jgi:hypothetical protein
MKVSVNDIAEAMVKSVEVTKPVHHDAEVQYDGEVCCRRLKESYDLFLWPQYNDGAFAKTKNDSSCSEL